jgi:hypothetical protein
MGHPLIDVDLAARQTKATLTAQRNAFLLQAVLAEIGDVPRGRIATAQHLVDDGLHLTLLVAGIALLERLPVLAEDLLEGRFVDPLKENS